MTPIELLGALMTLERRVPDRHVTVDEPMAAAWLPSVREFPAEVAMAVAKTWEGDAFPSAHEFLIECQAAARDLIASEAARYAANQLPMSSCPNRCDDGWIETNDEGRGTWAPCDRCHPVEHAIALHRTRPGHDENRCGDCIGLRKARGHAEPGWLTNARVRAEEVRARGYNVDVVVDDEEGRANIEAIRLMLAAARGPGEHNHRPDAAAPCVVCGGISPHNRRLVAERAAQRPPALAGPEF